MQPYRDRALVVRRYDLGEADRIIVLFTREHGIVRAVAKGVRRAKSRFGSRLAPFVDVDVAIYPSRSPARVRGGGLGTITGADTVHTWAAPIVDDYARYTTACAVLEVAERLVGEDGVPFPELWDITAETLSDIAAGHRSVDLLLTSFILRGMTEAGWAPSLFECAGCGKAGPHHAFAPSHGGAVCTNCRPPGAADVPTEVLHLMWLLANDGWGGINPEEPGFRARATSARVLATKHLQFHLARKVTALDLVEAFWD